MAEIEWTIEQARTGVATLTLARRHVHSAYDPEREAERLAHQVVDQAKKKPIHVETTAEFDSALATLDRDVTRPHLWIHPGYEHVCRFEARYALRELRSLSTPTPRLHRRDALVSERSLAAAGQRDTSRPRISSASRSLAIPVP